jgi:hypothetical protein
MEYDSPDSIVDQQIHNLGKCRQIIALKADDKELPDYLFNGQPRHQVLDKRVRGLVIIAILGQQEIAPCCSVNGKHKQQQPTYGKTSNRLTPGHGYAPRSDGAKYTRLWNERQNIVSFAV